jgi:purine-binding chemotaxis protein CheW
MTTPSMTASPQTSCCHCCFLVGGDCFAVPSANVAEVLRDSRITRVPHAPEAVLGLLHLRGRIVPVIDMRRRLGVATAAPSAARTHVVVRLDDDWYSLLVDEMLDVIEVAEDLIEHPSRPAADSPHDAVSGVFAGPGRLVHFLDPKRIVQLPVRQREQSLQRQGATHGGS